MTTTKNRGQQRRRQPAEDINATLNPTIISTIETTIHDTMRNQQVPGFAIGIVKDGQSAYARGFGVAGVDNQTPITTRSNFLMASMSKAFTATAIMQLVEAGKISLDAPVTAYLPYFLLADERSSDIVIRHLLTHTSGLTFWSEPAFAAETILEYWRKVTPEFDAGAAERYVRGLRDTTLPFAPGTSYAYSDMGFNVLGEVITKVSGQPFDAYMQEHILIPCGMHDSTFLPQEVDQELLAKPHHLDESGNVVESAVFPFTRPYAPCSQLLSNVEDMLRWAQVNLNRGALDGTRILTEASYAVLWAAQVAPAAIDPSGAATRSYGFGWSIDQMDGKPIVNHAGGELGYHSYIVLAPEDATAVVTMGNRLDTFNEPFYAVDIGTMAMTLLVRNERDAG